MSKNIFFYKNASPYDYLSNLSTVPVSVWINGKAYNNLPCSESIYQGVKDVNNVNAQLILQGQITGAQIQKVGTTIQNNLFRTTQKNSQVGSEFKEQLMKEIIEMKATQHPEILHSICHYRSKGFNFVENTQLASYNDDFWGNGLQGNGRNALGKLWDDLANDFTNKINSNQTIQVRTGFSQKICTQLNMQYDAQKEFSNTVNSNNSNYQPITFASQIKSTYQLNNVNTNLNNVTNNNNVCSDYIDYDAIKNDNQSSVKRFFDSVANNNKIIGLKVDNDTNGSGAKVFKIKFASQFDASSFNQKFCYAHGVNNSLKAVGNGDTLICRNGKFDILCKDYGLTGHGKTHPRPMSEAITHDYDTLNHNDVHYQHQHLQNNNLQYQSYNQNVNPQYVQYNNLQYQSYNQNVNPQYVQYNNLQYQPCNQNVNPQYVQYNNLQYQPCNQNINPEYCNKTSLTSSQKFIATLSIMGFKISFMQLKTNSYDNKPVLSLVFSDKESFFEFINNYQIQTFCAKNDFNEVILGQNKIDYLFEQEFINCLGDVPHDLNHDFYI